MFNKGDKAIIFCEGHSLHLRECIISDIKEEDKLYKIVVNGIAYYADSNHLLHNNCIYANDMR